VSIPKSKNPTLYYYADMTGQIHDVPNTIFLCQTFGFQNVHEVPQRIMTIPNGWGIFMPIINWISIPEEKGDYIEDLKKLATEKMDEAANLRFSINEKLVPLDLSGFRVQSVVNNIVLPNDNILEVEPCTTSIVVDGYWIFFQPLVKNLSLETFGSCQSGITKIAVSYRLAVADR
jgi:hypothetical protein